MTQLILNITSQCKFLNSIITDDVIAYCIKNKEENKDGGKTVFFLTPYKLTKALGSCMN